VVVRPGTREMHTSFSRCCTGVGQEPTAGPIETSSRRTTDDVRSNVTVVAGAAKPGSAQQASAFGLRPAAPRTPHQVRLWTSRCDRSQPPLHESQGRASARERPAPPRHYKLGTLTSALRSRSAGSRRSRHPARTDIGMWPSDIALSAVTHPECLQAQALVTLADHRPVNNRPESFAEAAICATAGRLTSHGLREKAA